MSSIPTMKNFLDFAEMKPANEEYTYADPNICACHQFAAHVGMKELYMQGRAATEYTGVAVVDYPFYPMEAIAMLEPHTFGALATRIKQLG